MPGLYLTPFIGDLDIDVLAARAYFAVIERTAMKILTTELTDLISPLGIAVVREGGRNEEEEDREDAHW
jgi:hypothetical protein